MSTTASAAVSTLLSGSNVTSGIDTKTLVNSLIEAEREAITPTETKKTAAQSQLTVVQSLNTKFAYAVTDSEKLKDPSAFSARTATSGDEDVFTATATSSAATGAYSIRVDALAQAEQIIGSAVSSTATYTGTITVQVGAGEAFTYEANNATLAHIINAFNGSTTANIKAEIVDVGDGTSRIMLTSKSSGSANTIALSGDLATSGPFESAATITDAQDASVTIRLGSNTTIDLSRTSATNTLSDLVDGVSVSLTATSEKFVQISIVNDTSSVVDTISSFIDTLNSALNEYGLNSGYDSATSTSGVLFSNSSVRSQIAAVKRAMDGQDANGKSLETLGITYNSTTGLYELDSTTLTSLLGSDPDAVTSLFIDSGLGAAVYNSLDALTHKGNGVFTMLDETLSDSIASCTDRITAFEDRLAARKTRYEKQFLAMEKTIASLKSQESALTSFTDGLKSSSS
jgi:flagellar hook-associated protein 2